MTDPLVVGSAVIGPADLSQYRCRDEAERIVFDLAARGAQLVVLPELFALPYFAAEQPAAWRHLAEPEDGPTARWAEALAARAGVTVLYGAAIDDGGARPLNAAMLARPGRTAEIVAGKLHLPPAAEGDTFGEADHFDPAPPLIEAFEIGTARVAVLICYDRRFPECWRAAAAAGADCVAVLVAGPAPEDPDGLFEAELMTHARANAVYAISAARTGVETVTGRKVRHDGRTLAFDPDGRLVAEVPAQSRGGLLVTIDPDRCRRARAANATGAHLRIPLSPPQFPSNERSSACLR